MRNHLSITDGTYTATASGQKNVNIPLTPITGDVVVCFGSLTSTDTDGTQCVCVFKDAAGTTLESIRSNRGSNVSVQGHLGSSIATLMELYPAYSYQQASSDTVTWSNGMVIEKELYDIDPSYQPYAAPNSELTILEAEDRAALAEEIDAGAKNKLNFDIASLKALNTSGTWSGNSYTKNGVTFTYNDSTKTISTYGTSTSNTTIFYLMNFTPTSGASYTISGCPSGGSTTGYRFCNMGQTWVNDYGSSDTAVGDGTSKEMAIYVNNSGTAVGTSSNPLTWKPMICTKAAFSVSPKFVPYAKSNYSLTQSVVDIATTSLVDKLGKNLLTIQPRYYSATGVSIAVNADKTVTVSVTGTVSSDLTYILDDQISMSRSMLLNKTLVLSGKPKGISDLIRLQFLNYTTTEWSFAIDDGNGAHFTFTNSGNLSFNVAIVVKAGAPVGTYVIKPMLCFEELYNMDPTYVSPDYAIRSVNILRNEARLNGVVNTGTYSPNDPTITSSMFDLPATHPTNCTFLLRVAQIDQYRILQEITFADLEATSNQLSAYKRYRTASGAWTNWQS